MQQETPSSRIAGRSDRVQIHLHQTNERRGYREIAGHFLYSAFGLIHTETPFPADRAETFVRLRPENLHSVPQHLQGSGRQPDTHQAETERPNYGRFLQPILRPEPVPNVSESSS